MTTPEFPKGKEKYCPKCYFENNETILREDCKHSNKMNKLQEYERDVMEKFVEQGADLEHDRWARWQKYMFSKCSSLPTGELIIPASLVQRWFSQIERPYSKLSEDEKESDRKETRNYLPLLLSALQGQRKVIEEWIDKNPIRCGACDGANLGHTLTCKMLSELKSFLSESNNK